MAAGREQYEIQTSKENRWTIVQVVPGQDEAIAKAKALLKSNPNLDAAQVVRTWMRTDGSSTEKVVFSEQQGKRERQATVAFIEDAYFCKDVEDVYALDSRRTIGKLLRKYLDMYFVTPTELLYCHRHLKKLLDDGGLVPGAIDRAASIHAKMANVASKDRAQELYAFLDKVVAKARTLEQNKQITEIEGTDFAGLIKSIDYTAITDMRKFMIMASLAQYLMGSRSWEDKLVKILSLVDIDPDPSHLVLLDEVIAEILDAASVVQELLGHQPGLGIALSKIADLMAGRLAFPPNRKGPEQPIETLNTLFGVYAMEASKAVLIDRIRKEVSGSKPLARDKSEEGDAFAELVARLLDPNGSFVGGTPMVQAIMDRTGLMVGANGETLPPKDRIGEVMKLIPEIKSKIRFLLVLTHTAFGAKQMAVVCAMLKEFIVPVKEIHELCYFREPPKKKLGDISGMQRQAQASLLPDEVKSRVVEKLDTLLADFIVKEQIIEKFDNPSDPLRIRAIRLVQFCASGLLTEGKALNLARERTREHLRQAQFIERFTEGIADPTQQEKALRDFRQLLDKAGFNG